jgi:hypothetical protein
MSELKPCDWVIAEHPMMYDSHRVYQIKSVTKSMFIGYFGKTDPDGYRNEEKRARKSIIGVLHPEADPEVTIQVIKEQKAILMAAEKAAKAAYHTSVKALLNPPTS